jgi:hypothetical protein
MSLETATDVEQIETVKDEQGNRKAPANAAEQQAMQSEQQKTTAALGNQPGVGAFSYSTNGTDAEALPSNPVPDGVTVLVQADPSNTDPIKVGDADEQPLTIKGTQGLKFAVEDTSAIHIRALTAGDSVGVAFEEGA